MKDCSTTGARKVQFLFDLFEYCILQMQCIIPDKTSAEMELKLNISLGRL